MPMTFTGIPLLFIAAATLSAVVQAADPEPSSLVERLLADNARIRSVQCEIRRETEAGGSIVPTLSRVWFERPDRLRVETVTPHPRRIVVDGTAIHKWIDGHTNGVRILLAEAPEQELIQVRRTPATAEEYLLRLKGIPETSLPPEPDYPVRRAYTPQDRHPYTILALDTTGRLARLEFFDPAGKTNRLLRVDFGGWKEISQGIWIACFQKSEGMGRNGTGFKETLRVSSLKVNEPIDPANFDISLRAAGVHFLKPDDMTKVLQRPDNKTR